MKILKNVFLLLILILSNNNLFSQCANPSNIYSFIYNGHSYEVIKENRSWTAASACAVSRNGYLAEINDSAEQNAIFNELTNNAGINIANTQNQFGTASIWLGGSDSGIEGDWIWDGDNDGNGPQFWSGASNGNPVGGLYTNWGTSPAEPDNSGGQDHLTIIINPAAINFSLWNDLISTNSIYYLIEYDIILSIQDLEFKKNITISPNPFNNKITINNDNSISIDRVVIFNLMGQKMKSFGSNEIVNSSIDVNSLSKGIYILNVYFRNGKSISRKIVK